MSVIMHFCDADHIANAGHALGYSQHDFFWTVGWLA
jgi:hypothetical protein